MAARELPARQSERETGKRRFKLKYAPHFGMFKHSAGNDLTDQLRFASDQGFTAWEDSGMKGRPVDTQNRIAKTMESLGMEMGAFVATASFSEITFAGKNDGKWEAVLQDIRDSVEIAKRVNAKWMSVVPGCDDRGLEWDRQMANGIELLKRCCDVLEPHGLVMVLEPQDWCSDQFGCFLHKTSQAYQICRAVDSPSCKILFDIYHRQVTEGNLISNMDKAWTEIAYFQWGDSPGRREPGTGEINHRSLFRFVHSKGFGGIVGMEHGNSKPGKEGEQAVIDAYVKADRF